MRLRFLLMTGLICAGLAFAAESTIELPQPLSDNAVAILKLHGQFVLFSMMGLGPKKTWDAVSNAAYLFDAWSGKAKTIHAVPGTVGRIGATAVGAADHVFLFGGYVLFQGGGMVVPDMNVYEPANDRWVRGPDIPTAVGDAVIGVYRERYIYLIGGRSDHGPVADVQIYDMQKYRWLKSTSFAGTPVFGHAGGLAGDTIVYVDGARKNDVAGGPRFVASDECWMGKIDHHDPAKIQWTKLPSHPGNARFRIAAGASDKDSMIYFSGGSDNPHDYNGIGYDGKPSEPSPVTFAFNLKSEKWQMISDNTPQPTMDHRGLLVTPEGLVIIGGMEENQKVTAKIAVVPKTVKK
jgi:N-acetylneuraminic acid mutarotase